MFEFNQLIAVDAPLVITIGSFDGLHLGHRQLLQFLNEKAAQQNAKSLVISFLPHPRIFFNVQKDFYLLNDLQEKRRLMDAMEIDYLMQLPFDATFASQSAEELHQEADATDALRHGGAQGAGGLRPRRDSFAQELPAVSEAARPAARDEWHQIPRTRDGADR
jgi:hypothetical protein